MQEPQLTNSHPISETLPEQQSVDAICAAHGKYVAKLLHTEFGPPIQSRCPQCSAERQAEDAARKEREANFERQLRLASLVHAAGIPARFAERNFDGYSAETQGQKIALAVCRGFADKWPEKLVSGESLVLTGGPGTGKTHLACSIASAVMERHLASVAFGTVSTFLRHIKSTYAKDSEISEQDAMDDMLRPDLLIVDEVGAQIGSEHEKLLMFEIFNSRYQDMRPTILISNLDLRELEIFLGHRVMDRYRECGAVLGFDWQSYRGRK